MAIRYLHTQHNKLNAHANLYISIGIRKHDSAFERPDTAHALGSVATVMGTVRDEMENKLHKRKPFTFQIVGLWN
jgi:hypothetical protein